MNRLFLPIIAALGIGAIFFSSSTDEDDNDVITEGSENEIDTAAEDEDIDLDDLLDFEETEDEEEDDEEPTRVSDNEEDQFDPEDMERDEDLEAELDRLEENTGLESHECLSLINNRLEEDPDFIIEEIIA